jgi:hypothetical protein
MMELREMKGLILRRDRLLLVILCTVHNRSRFTSNRDTENFGRMAKKTGKSLKQEGFRTPSFPGSFLDYGLRNGLRRENL